MKTHNLDEFREYRYPKEIHNYPLILDFTNQYLKENDLTKWSRYKTFLLDKNNKVLLVGNPTYNKKLMKLYKQEINKRLE